MSGAAPQADPSLDPHENPVARDGAIWHRVREHKIIQWALGYLAAALALTHAEELIGRAFDWPEFVSRALIVVLALGLPVAITLAWYHGHRASRHVSGAEATIIAILLLIGSGLLLLLVHPHEPSQTQSEVEYSATNSASSAVALASRSAGLAPGPTAVMRFQIPLPEKTTLLVANAFALSPDGRQLAFAASGPDGVARLWIRPLDSLEARPLPGSESRNLLAFFFWSPDSRFIAFDAVGKLKKVPVSGGPAETICDLSPGMTAVGGSWNRDGVIIFGQSQGGLMQVSAAGGTASPLTAVDRSRREVHHIAPWFLPDGRHFIYSRQGDAAELNGLYVGSLGVPQGQVAKQLIATQSAMVAYAPTTTSEVGRLFFARDGTLLAQPFDPVRLELHGEPTALAENLADFLGSAAFHLSANGILVYRVGGAGSFQPTWYDRNGKLLGAIGEEHRGLESVRLSPDGKWAAVATGYDNGSDAGSNIIAIWLLDFARGTSTRFTFGSSNSRMPVWSPDGSRIIFASDRGGHYDLYQKVANGGADEQLLLKSEQDKYPSSWSRDGHFLLYTVIDPKTGSDMWVLPLEGDRKPFPLLRTGLTEGSGQFSPDGRWVAYMSDESGRAEVYVRPFAADLNGRSSGPGGKWLISDGGGFFPHWRADGKELYYNDPRSRIIAVDVSASPGFKPGVPKYLFPTPIENPLALPNQWDVTPDGERFLISTATSQSTRAPFTIVSNWPALLNR